MYETYDPNFVRTACKIRVIRNAECRMRNGARNHSQTSDHTRTLVFLSVVASYAYTNLAAWILRASAEHVGLPRVSRKWRWHEVEASRNDSLPVALIRLVRFQPAVLAATFHSV